MRGLIGSIGALLVSAAILLVGGGLLGTLVALAAEAHGFPIITIGFLSSAYFAGFMGGCLATPILVKRVGHVRVFAALSSLIAACALTHVLLINVPIWMILRGLVGFSFAGLYILIESWINEQSPNDKRGQVVSIYRMVDLVAITIGQFMITLAEPTDFVLFSVVAILISLSIFPISISSSKAPLAVSKTKLDIKKLIRIAPLAVVGCFSVGLTGGAFWGVAPVFVKQMDYSVLIVSLFMSIVIFMGAVMQWPMGWLSDKIGRRKVMIIASLGASASGVFLWQFAPQSLNMLLIGGGLFGMFAMQVYGMAAAHANDYAEADEFVAISGGLLLVYGIGSVIGPTLAPIIMSLAGPSALFGYTAVIHLALAIYGIYRLTRRESATTQVDYVPIPRPRAVLLMRGSDKRILRKRKRGAK